jgi:hypothetical protein
MRVMSYVANHHDLRQHINFKILVDSSTSTTAVVAS